MPLDSNRDAVKKPAIRKVVLSLALILTGMSIVMRYACEFSGRPLPNGVKYAGLAIEVPLSAQDIREILGCGRDDKVAVVCGHSGSDVQDRASMRRAQYYDFAFILFYVAFFWVIGVMQLRAFTPQATSRHNKKANWWQRLKQRRARIMAVLSILLVVVAGVLDYKEDFAILNTLNQAASVGMPSAVSITQWAWPKWWCLFVMLIFQLPLMWAGQSGANLFTLISRLLAAFAVFSGASGMIACWFQHPARLESAAMGLSCVPLYVFAREMVGDGSRTGLNRIAESRLLSWLTRWPGFLLGEYEPAAESIEGQLLMVEQGRSSPC